MDQRTAWENFVNTGSIKDYLIYSQMKQDDNNEVQGAVSYANPYGWVDNNGTERRGE